VLTILIKLCHFLNYYFTTKTIFFISLNKGRCYNNGVIVRALYPQSRAQERRKSYGNIAYVAAAIWFGKKRAAKLSAK